MRKRMSVVGLYEYSGGGGGGGGGGATALSTTGGSVVEAALVGVGLAAGVEGVG